MKWRSILSGTLAVIMAASGLAPMGTLKTQAEESVYTVSAPTEDLEVQFWLDDAGTPWYQVTRNGVELIEDAKMGLNTSLGNLSTGLSLKGEPVTDTADSTWKPVVGEQGEIRDCYNETAFTLMQEATGLEFGIVMRAYDEGVAFQYILPELPEGTDAYTVSDEMTQFVFPAGTKASLHVGNNQTMPGKYSVESFPSNTVRRPATFMYADGQHLTICEGNLDNYSIMVLEKSSTARALEADYAGTVTVDAEDGPAATPWRVLVMGDGATGLLENDIIVQNLNEPADEATYKFSEWLDPGTCVRATRGLNNGAIRTVIDLAAEHGIRYVLLDSGWYGPEYDKNADPRLDPAALDPDNAQDAILLEKYFADTGGYNNTGEGVFNTRGVGFNQYGSLGDGGSTQVNVDIPDLCAYANSKGVGIVLYVNGVFFPDSSGRNRFTADELFAYYEKWGVAGVKPGFVNCRTQQYEKHMEEVIAAAAKHKLVLTIHDEYVPAGLERTYPNLMMTEGILGDEGIGRNSPCAAEDIAAIFTRNVQGPADHTFCYPGKATKVYALASPILYRSGMSVLYWYTDPEKVPAQDVGKMGIWEDMPTTWEESLFLEGSLYEYATTARRTAEDVWYVGSLSAIDRRLEISLDFLEEGVTYVAEVYADGIDADPYAGWEAGAGSKKGAQTLDYRQYLVTSEDVLERDLKYGFGYAAVLTKAGEEDLAAYTPYNVYRQELELEILRAEEIEESDYTTESWDLFEAAKAAAEQIIADENAQNTGMEEAAAALKAAREALVSTGGLEDAIAGTVHYTSYHYTENSWKTLEKAVAEGNALLESGSFTQADLDAAEKAVTDAVKGLTPDPNRVIKNTVYLDELDYDTARSYAHASAIKKKTDYYGSTLSLMVDGTEQIFERGMMTHAQAEIFYNIEGKGYEVFEAYVGVDTVKATQGDIIFRVYGDDVLLYESEPSGNGSQNAQHLSVPVAGVKELRLEANMKGSNDGDHGIWGDAKFLTYRDPNAYLTGIAVDGATLAGFSKDQFVYYVKAEIGQIPQIDVIREETDFEYEIVDAEEIPGYTEIIVKKRDGSTMNYRVYLLPAEQGEYLSDFPSNLILKNTLYGFTKDKAQGGLQLALTDTDGSSMVTFEKGIGTHATVSGDSMIVYDLSGKDYDLFEGWVGISYLKNDNRSKINFKIYVDEETTPRFESGAMTYRAPAKFYSVDVRGVQKLTLVADPCGDQSADHGCWCDAKFLNYTGVWPVTGTVDVADTGLESEGILVKLYEMTDGAAASKPLAIAETDENGGYIFENVFAGDYVIKVEKGENHLEAVAELTVENQAIEQNLTLVAPEFDINVEQPEDAVVLTNVQRAVRGETVTIYIKNLKEGMAVAEISVTGKNGDAIETTVSGEQADSYTFIMPQQKVTVSVTLTENAEYAGAAAAAKALDEKIAAVGDVTLEKEALIKELREEYEALSDAAKELVEKKSLLETQEYVLEALTAAEAAKKNAEEAQATVDAAKAEAKEAAKAAQEAQAAAEEAAQSTATDKAAAEEAKEAAKQAQLKAEEAQLKAEEVKTQAEAANAEAKAAQEAAVEAQEAAETAKTAAETANAQATAEALKAAEEAANAAAKAQQATQEAAKAAEEGTKAAAEANRAAVSAASAAEAQAKAQEAAGVAEEAKVKAETAKAAAETAQQKAEEAKQAAEEAAASSAENKEAAVEAQAAAETAKEKAEAAQAAAQEAQDSAETAEAAAETAKNKAEEASAAAEQSNAEAAKAAEEAAKEAVKSAEEAAKSANYSAQAAQAAQTAAESSAQAAEAMAKAQEAQAKAEAAQKAAEEAAAKAEAEKKAAEEAAAKAEAEKKAAEEAKAAAEFAVKKQEAMMEVSLLAGKADTETFSGMQSEAFDKALDEAVEKILAAESQDVLEEAAAGLQEAIEEIEASASVKRFVDVYDYDWFYDVVDYVAYHGLMTGTDDTHFAPMESLTRAQFAMILYRMEGAPEVDTDKAFDDVYEGQWYTDAVLWAADKGIVTGYAGTANYGPEDQVTREQMVTMMYRYADYLGEELQLNGELENFEDGALVSPYAEEAMQWATGTGIITGKNGVALDPQGTTTRGEAAAVVQRFVTGYVTE